MRTHTESYKVFKKELDDLWNFALMISYAVPSLNKTIKGVEEKVPDYSLPRPDYFFYDNSSNEDLKKHMGGYKQRLAAYLWLSIFSFFEAYVTNVLDELVCFHGGKSEFIEISEKSTKKKMNSITEEMFQTVYKGKLHNTYDPLRNSKNITYTRTLLNMEYPFPTEFFSTLGIKFFINQLKDIRAKDIPDVMKNSFNFNMDNQTEKKFLHYKDIRNNIAHGKPKQLSLIDVKEMYRTLIKLARRFDSHLLKYYFINERFRSYYLNETT